MEKTERHISNAFDENLFTPDERELVQTREEFLQQEEKNNPKIWNLATIGGIILFFTGFSALLQFAGLNIGPDLSRIVEFLPLVGAILVTFVGFGFIAGKRGKIKGVNKKTVSRRFGETFDTSGSGHKASKTYTSGNSSRSTTSEDVEFERYALEKRKKLYRSRTDKKLFGVCGGLAEYFGVSPTVVRVIFGLGTLLGYGSFFLLYMVLIFVIPKEPKDMKDRFSK